MSPRMRNGLIVAALHVAIVASLGAKLLVDRASRPRVWGRAAPVDPDLPIRGRYIRLRIEGQADFAPLSETVRVVPSVRGEALVFLRSPSETGLTAHMTQTRDGTRVAVLDQPLAFFIPEHAADPSRRADNEELWVEVTLPSRGVPRPIRLGVKRDGVLTPLK